MLNPNVAHTLQVSYNNFCHSHKLSDFNPMYKKSQNADKLMMGYALCPQ